MNEQWKMVPVEPTPEMITAAHAGEVHTADVASAIRRAEVFQRRYKAALAAAPQPPDDELGRLERDAAVKDAVEREQIRIMNIIEGCENLEGEMTVSGYTLCTAIRARGES